MNVRKCRAFAVVTIVVSMLGVGAVFAEDVEKKWRFGFHAGVSNPQDEIPSDAANVLTILDDEFMFIDQFIDPRDDSSVFGTLELKPAPLGTASVQYAVNKIFIVEGSVGYSKTDLGKVEVQAQFFQVPVDPDINFNFATFRIDAGEVERVPIQLSGIARFRPRASFNPYLGGGIGYTIVGYEASPEFNQLSLNLDSSQGARATVTSVIGGSPSLTQPSADSVRDFSGAEVEARDTFEWHALLGAEYTIKPNWALVFDLRYTFSSRTLRVGFDGSDDFGDSVPQLTDFSTGFAANQNYGAMSVLVGGLVDGGSLQPNIGQPPTTDCNDPQQAQNCFFDSTMKDGVVDPGFYYINGGQIKYDAFTFQFGARFTF